jgi:hypothetical protein
VSQQKVLGLLARPPLRPGRPPCFPPASSCSSLDTNQQLDMGLSLELSVCSPPTLYEPCDPAATQPLASPCTPLLCGGGGSRYATP